MVDPTPEGVEAWLDFAHQYNVDLQVAELGKDAALARARAAASPTFLRSASRCSERLITRKRTSLMLWTTVPCWSPGTRIKTHRRERHHAPLRRWSNQRPAPRSLRALRCSGDEPRNHPAPGATANARLLHQREAGCGPHPNTCAQAIKSTQAALDAAQTDTKWARGTW